MLSYSKEQGLPLLKDDTIYLKRFKSQDLNQTIQKSDSLPDMFIKVSYNICTCIHLN